MKVSSVNGLLSTYDVKNSKSVAFEKKYPLYDIMCIMSCSLAHNQESVSKTISSILSKEQPATYSQQLMDLYNVRCMLFKNYPELAAVSAKFKTALNAINKDYTKLDKYYEQKTAVDIAKKYGTDMVDIVV